MFFLNYFRKGKKKGKPLLTCLRANNNHRALRLLEDCKYKPCERLSNSFDRIMFFLRESLREALCVRMARRLAIKYRNANHHLVFRNSCVQNLLSM